MMGFIIHILYTKTLDELYIEEEKYGTLVVGISLRTYHAKLYTMLLLFRNVLTAAVIVFGEKDFFAQITILIIITVLIVLLLFKRITFQDPLENRKTRITEILLVPTMFCFGALGAQRKSILFYDLFGWIAVSIVGIIFLNELHYIATLQIRNIKGIIKTVKEKLRSRKPKW